MILLLYEVESPKIASCRPGFSVFLDIFRDNFFFNRFFSYSLFTFPCIFLAPLVAGGMAMIFR